MVAVVAAVAVAVAVAVVGITMLGGGAWCGAVRLLVAASRGTHWKGSWARVRVEETSLVIEGDGSDQYARSHQRSYRLPIKA